MIQSVIRRLQNGSIDYKRRPGRGRKTTTRTDRHIEFAVLRDRQVTLRELQADLTAVTGQPVSHSLISRRLSEKGLNARRPRKNPHCVSTRESLRANDVNVLEWPSRSPYATPIEHLWLWLKVRVNRLHPRTTADLWAAVQTAWASIPVDLVQTLVDSLPRRVEAIRRAKGGWTKC